MYWPNQSTLKLKVSCRNGSKKAVKFLPSRVICSSILLVQYQSGRVLCICKTCHDRQNISFMTRYLPVLGNVRSDDTHVIETRWIRVSRRSCKYVASASLDSGNITAWDALFARRLNRLLQFVYVWNVWAFSSELIDSLLLHRIWRLSAHHHHHHNRHHDMYGAALLHVPTPSSCGSFFSKLSRSLPLSNLYFCACLIILIWLRCTYGMWKIPSVVFSFNDILSFQYGKGKR